MTNNEPISDFQVSEKLWMQAHGRVLTALDALSPRARRRLDPDLGTALKGLVSSFNRFTEDVHAETMRRVKAEARRDAAEDALIDSLITCVHLHTEVEQVDQDPPEGIYLTHTRPMIVEGWYAFPEVDHVEIEEGLVGLYRRLGTGTLLIRQLPLANVLEIRNAPVDSAFVAQCDEWTLANQGAPAWSEEDQELIESEGIGIVAAGAEGPAGE